MRRYKYTPRLRRQHVAPEDLARIERNIDSVIGNAVGTVEGYLRLVCACADNLTEAVERMELHARLPADLRAVYQIALQLTQGDQTSPEERYGYGLALSALAAAPETGCQGLAAELLAELRKHEPVLRFLA
jgi:hypothetical protein